MSTRKSKSILFLPLLSLCNFCALTAQETLKSLDNEISALIDASKVSVVTIASGFSREISAENEGGILSFFKDEIPKMSRSYLQIGSGIVFDNEGHILTRCSIVCGSKSNSVTFINGEEAEATFVGHDPETGFAVIKVNSSNLHPARFGNSDDIALGNWNLMIGNSLGVYPSVVFGSTNGFRADGLIQILADLSPGNNGSPVFNTSGQVVGLIAGQMDPQESITQPYFGSSFHSTILAYPSNWIKKIAKDIIKYGQVRPGWLGVIGYHDGWKPKIKEIKNNSPAEQAGLLKGDVILKFAYREVSSISELVRLVKYTSPGEVVPLEFVRSGEPMHVDVRIGEKYYGDKSEDTAVRTTKEANVLSREQKERWLLMKIRKLERELNELKKIVQQ